MRHGRFNIGCRTARQPVLQRIPHHRRMPMAIVGLSASLAFSMVPANPRSSVLGSDSTSADKSSEPPTWFSQTSVRHALHVPGEGGWCQCTKKSVFRGNFIGPLAIGDPSAPPATTNLLSRVIEYTGNVIIGSGGLDMLVPTNGTLLVLQNVTWGGVQGFRERPAKPVSSCPQIFGKELSLMGRASSTRPTQSTQI